MNDKPVILVVEDEDSIRLTLRDYLKKKGHEVIVASDGVALKVRLRAAYPALVLHIIEAVAFELQLFQR